MKNDRHRDVSTHISPVHFQGRDITHSQEPLPWAWLSVGRLVLPLLAFTVLLLLILGTWLLPRGTAPAQPPSLDTQITARLASQPIIPLTADASTDLSADSLHEAIHNLGHQAPLQIDPIEENYINTSDLYGYVIDLLPLASKGDGSAQYYIYLSLEECRAYLGPNGRATLRETTLKPFWREYDSPAESVSNAERKLWLHEYQRCKNFVDASLLSIESALGEDLPGAVNEYGSVWFERAVLTGFPLALSDMAFRSSGVSTEYPSQLLREAAMSFDPRVFLNIFEKSWDSTTPEINRVPAMAWLILACRSGLDCREEAHWFRIRYCTGNRPLACSTGQTAVMYFWETLADQEQIAAYRMSIDIDQQLAEGQWVNLPLFLF